MDEMIGTATIRGGAGGATVAHQALAAQVHAAKTHAVERLETMSRFPRIRPAIGRAGLRTR
jgi:hypothetical protein